METAVLTSLIGVGGVVLGGLVNAPEFRGLFKSRISTGKDLMGEWLCEWFIDDNQPTSEPVVKDRIVINKIEGTKILATGVSPLMNEYKLTGLISLSNVVTFTFQGTQKQTLTGVIILQLNTLRDEMGGHWHQISPEGKFVGGRTVWKKGAGSGR